MENETKLIRGTNMMSVLLRFNEKEKVIGELILRNGVLHFEGRADESAKLLFNAFKELVDNYIKQEKEK